MKEIRKLPKHVTKMFQPKNEGRKNARKYDEHQNQNFENAFFFELFPGFAVVFFSLPVGMPWEKFRSDLSYSFACIPGADTFPCPPYVA